MNAQTLFHTHNTYFLQLSHHAFIRLNIFPSYFLFRVAILSCVELVLPPVHLPLRSQENHKAAIADCSEAITLNPLYLKATVRRAELYEKTDKLDEALEDYTKTLELDPSHHAARFACMVTTRCHLCRMLL